MGIIGGEVPRIISILKKFRGTMQGGHEIPVRCTIRVGPSKMSGRARRSCSTVSVEDRFSMKGIPSKIRFQHANPVMERD